MLPWKLQKSQFLPVNQNLSSVYFSPAKFQLVICNLFLATIWQMTYTHKLPKLCSATLTRQSNLQKMQEVVVKIFPLRQFQTLFSLIFLFFPSSNFSPYYQIILIINYSHFLILEKKNSLYISTTIIVLDLG